MAEGFKWIIANRLAGMELPGSVAPAVDDLLFLAKQGIRVVVSLTERAPVYDTHLKRKFEWVHFPIDDFKAPQPGPTLELVERIDGWLHAGRPVMIHCLAGIGRTGTILACYMIYKYREPASGVLPWLRRIDPHYVQSRVQEEFLDRFEELALAHPPPPPPDW